MDKLPKKVELKLDDQGELGSAVASAAVVALRYMIANPSKEVEFLYFKILPIS